MNYELMNTNLFGFAALRFSLFIYLLTSLFKNRKKENPLNQYKI